MKRMNMAVVALALIAIVAPVSAGVWIFSNIVTVHGDVTRNVGVHPGDWFNYSVTIGGNGTLSPGNWLVGLEWVLLQVTDVSGTNVEYGEI
ncbi:MAG: hypothetical protein MUO82_07810 [Candidatus Thermoplasmatota archaeon]|nr:hypothetical protein [Candidatus Thermoplasmatota archaeon]